MINYLKKLMLGNIVANVIYIAFGIILIARTTLMINLISLALGVIIISNALIAIMKFISDESKTKFFKWELIYGIIALILGLLIIFNPFNIFNFFIVGFGIWLIIDGVMKVWYGIFFKKKKEEIWLLTIGIGIVSMILGIVLAFNPFSGVMVFTEVLGIFVISCGLLDIMNSMLFYRRIRNIVKLIS